VSYALPGAPHPPTPALTSALPSPRLSTLAVGGAEDTSDIFQALFEQL
jgi:hypothetical protein